MRNLTSNSCSDCGAIQRNSRASELSLLIGREGSFTPDVRATEMCSQPVIAQPTVPVPETRSYRSLIVFGNMVVALAVILILGIVSFFVGILATAL